MPADGSADATGELRALITAELPDIANPVELAHGGFGVVFKAQQPALSRDVAVKILTTAVYDERVRLRFERECAAMGMLSDHPSILTVYDAGFTASGRPYLVMDLMTGGALADRLAPGHGMRATEVLPIIVRVAAALETAHRAGVLHRDIKPENIMVSAYGEPQLGDFGIARLQGAEETKTESLTASIAHVSPELLGGEPPSVASDVYALGSTMFMLLAGNPAFVRTTDTSIIPALARITGEAVPDLRPVGVPDVVATFVERVMAKDPADRPATAEAVAREAQVLEKAMGLPVSPVRIPDVPTHLAEQLAEVEVLVQPPAITEASRLAGIAGAPTPSSAPPMPETLRHGGPPPMGEPTTARPSSRVPLIAGAAALVVVVGVTGALLLGGGDDPLPQPVSSDVQTASPSDAAVVDPTDPGPTASEVLPDATASTGAGGPQDIADSQLVDQVALVRELDVAAITAVGLPVTEYRDLMAAMAESSALGPLEPRGRVLQALGVLPDTVDLPTLMPDLYAEQFLGVYDAVGGRVVLRSSGETLTPLQRSILATETVPALLDATYDIAGMRDRADGSDGRRALATLVDGDTLITAEVWQNRFMTPAEQSQVDADFALLSDQVARSAPAAVRADLIFPFQIGNEFVRSLFAVGNLAAVDAAYADPPTTTEQVLHPEKYQAREPALEVQVTAEPGPDWTPVLEDTFGEFDLRQLATDLSTDRAVTVGSGWGGGRIRGWARGQETAVAIALRFDTEQDAVEACQAIGDVFRAATGATLAEGDLLQATDRAMRLRCEGDAVGVGVAPDADTATELAG